MSGGQSPRVAAGLACLSAALDAKSGVLKRGQAAELLEHVARLTPEEDQLIDAVRWFALASIERQAWAGAMLLDFVDLWSFKAIPPEDAAAMAEVAPEFDWQRRADING